VIIRCDKHFIAELQKHGYDIDYKKLRAIYAKSREAKERGVYPENDKANS